LCICLNSDDPAYFGGFINDNFDNFLNKFNEITPEQAQKYVVQLCKNSFMGSFITSEEK